MEFLCPNFLDDPREYEDAQSIWRLRWEELVAHSPEHGRWEEPWLNTTFNDGTPCRDGNPIFSAVSHSQRRGIRVIQLKPSDDPKEFSFYVDTFAEGEPEAIKELVISCVLTDETLLNSIDLMDQWINGGEVRIEQQNYRTAFPSASRRPQEEHFDLAGV